MSLEEEFDDIIRQKSNEMEFPFDEKNWEKAAAMLDVERKVAMGGSRKSIYLALSVATLFTLATIVELNYLPRTNKQEKLLANTAKNKTTISFKTTEKNDLLREKNNLGKFSQTQSFNKNLKLESVSIKSTHPEIISEKKSIQSTSAENSDFIATSQQTTFSDSTLPSNSNTTNNDAVDISFGENKNSIMEESRPETKARIFAPNFVASNENAEIEIYLLSPVMAGFPTSEEREINKLPFTALKCYDDDYYKNSAKHKTHFLNIELGGVYLLGWNTKNGKDGQGADWFGGLNYGLYLSRKISLSAGLQTYNIRNINQAFYSGKKTEYDFGAVTSNTVITSNNLCYLAAPLKINYSINSGNQISFGANAGCVVRAKNTVQTYQMQEEGNIKMNSHSTKNTALYEGVNSFNLMLTASYRTEITPRLFLSGEFIYGVSDIFKNNKSIKNQERLTGLRISLQYALFDR